MRYTAFLPNTDKDISGVVLYYHSEVFGKLEIPSALQTRVLALAGLYTSQNYALVVPNLVGYSNMSTEPHPFLLYPQQNVHSGVAALNALLKERLAQKYPKMKSFNLFVTGYGAGAANALWFEHCFNGNCTYNKEALNSSYKVKAAAALSGPYALVDIFLPFLK